MIETNEFKSQYLTVKIGESKSFKIMSDPVKVEKTRRGSEIEMNEKLKLSTAVKTYGELKVREYVQQNMKQYRENKDKTVGTVWIVGEEHLKNNSEIQANKETQLSYDQVLQNLK